MLDLNLHSFGYKFRYRGSAIAIPARLAIALLASALEYCRLQHSAQHKRLNVSHRVHPHEPLLPFAALPDVDLVPIQFLLTQYGSRESLLARPNDLKIR